MTKNLLISFITTLVFCFFAIFLEFILYKKYKVILEVDNRNLSEVEGMLYREKFINDENWNNLFFSRFSDFRVEIFVITNDLENGKDYISKIRKEFVKFNQRYTMDYINRNYDFLSNEIWKLGEDNNLIHDFSEKNQLFNIIKKNKQKQASCHSK